MRMGDGRLGNWRDMCIVMARRKSWEEGKHDELVNEVEWYKHYEFEAVVSRNYVKHVPTSQCVNRFLLYT
jgi:hypothetical protein